MTLKAADVQEEEMRALLLRPTSLLVPAIAPAIAIMVGVVIAGIVSPLLSALPSLNVLANSLYPPRFRA